MARKTIKRYRRLYSKMDKRKRKTKGKIRRKHRTKKLNKKGGSCCGSRPERDTRKKYYFMDGNGEITHTLLLDDDEIPDQRRVAATGGLRLLTHDQYMQYLRNRIKR